MFFRFRQLFVLLLYLIGIFSFVHARPVLVAVELSNQDQIRLWRNLDFPTYELINNTAITEVESDEIPILQGKGFQCQIIDDAPWQANYYIVDMPKDRGLSLPFTPIWHENQSYLIKIAANEKKKLFDLPFKFCQLKRNKLPNRFWDRLATKLVPLRLINWDPFVQSLVDQVNTDSIFSYVQRLQNFKTRLSFTDSSFAASEWIRQKFISWDYNAQFDSYYVYQTMWGYWPDTGYERNVVATTNGTMNPSKIYIACGHFDAFIYPETSVARTNAPGADDNASGTAAAMEIARIFRNYSWEPTLKFIGWSNEENGLLGSDDYARRADSLNWDIAGVVNLDMIAYQDNPVVDCNIQYAHNFSQWLSNLFYQAGQIYAPSVIFYREIFAGGSDDYSFAIRGFPAIWGGERWYYNNPHWHRLTDVINNFSAELFSNVTKTALATLAILGVYPDIVSGVIAYDVGDGNRLQINWTPNIETDVIGYNIYWSRTSQVYTDTLFVAGRLTSADTISNLMTDSTYYITVRALDIDNHESYLAFEITGVPRAIPFAPVGILATPIDSGIRIVWQKNLELDLAGYRIYRRLNENPNYDSLNITLLTDTTYTDIPLSGANKYYYALRAFDIQGNASPMSSEVYCRPITLDQGILIVDETRNGTNPPDSIQDRFYREILQGYRFNEYEYGSTAQKPIFADLVPYSSILWHGDDYGQLMAWENIPILKDYLNLGGNLWFVGWKPTGNLNNNTAYPFNFEPGSFIYDYLKISHADLSGANDSFQGTVGLLNYPDIDVDPDKVPLASWGGTMRYIEALIQVTTAQIIYTIDMKNNSSQFEGLPCAIRNLSEDYNSVFFGFPLYYMNQEQARAAAQQVMTDFGEPYGIKETAKIKLTALTFDLVQNQPNPFRRNTLINYQLPNRGFVALKIYNPTGKLIKTLVNEPQNPGFYSIKWDGRDDRNEKTSPGIYFCKLQIGERIIIKKMTVLK